MSIAMRTPIPEASIMSIVKRNGSTEPVNVNKIIAAVARCNEGLMYTDPFRVAQKTIAGLYNGATTKELDELSIRTAASLVAEEPEYSQLAARMLSEYIEKEVSNQNIHSFSLCIETGVEVGLINDRVAQFVKEHKRRLDAAIRFNSNRNFEYFGLRTVYDRYLLKHPISRKVIETPQYFFMRVACGVGGGNISETMELYRLFSTLEYMPSSPTLFNAGCTKEQMSSCYLLDSPEDSLEGIYSKYTDVARLSKYAGGIGVSWSKIRSQGSLIQGTNGHSNGIIPFIHTLDSSVLAINQGARRKGAACVYLETWHADLLDFLELRNNTGDHNRRAHNINLANWIPDIFMQRVESGGKWTFLDPRENPHLIDLYGEEFTKAYLLAEQESKFTKVMDAREVYAAMMRTLSQTGNGWMNFKDRANITSNQTANKENVIHLSNLCTEILEVTSPEEIAVCNLGSVNLGRHLTTRDGKVEFDFSKLARTVTAAVHQLNRVIDLNYYPLDDAFTSNMRWRPVGLGLMGLQDVFFSMRLPFDSDEARALSAKISEHIYYNALKESHLLAKKGGPHPAFSQTQAALGKLQFDHWPDAKFTIEKEKWDQLRADIKADGLRNSLLIAIAPTATIASICGCYECIEPHVNNLFKRETLSGDFVVVNRYLVNELKNLGQWDQATRDQIKLGDGSIKEIASISDSIKAIYRTVWEIPQRSLIDMAVDRGPFIDQSQSLNLFMENPNIGQLSSMYMYAWKKGIKTTYYLRSRPATKIAKTTVQSPSKEGMAVVGAEMDTLELAQAAVVCSLENPGSCDACG